MGPVTLALSIGTRRPKRRQGGSPRAAVLRSSHRRMHPLTTDSNWVMGPGTRLTRSLMRWKSSMERGTPADRAMAM